jgi:guanylate kinase
MPEPDRADALRRSIAARRARAALKTDIAEGRVTPQSVLRHAAADRATPAGTMRVTDFLMSVPAIGVVKRDRILTELTISPRRRLGGLGVRQHRALTGFLDKKQPEGTSRP